MINISSKNGVLKKSILTISLTALMGTTSAAPISLINQNFETGNLSGWNTLGEVSAVGETNVTTNNGTNYLISPNETTMAFLDSFGATVNQIESFLGIETGSLDANAGISQSLTNGSAISQSFFANAGDTVDMSWNYVARDYIPFSDPSFAVLVAPDGTAIIDVLASTTGPGFTTGSDGISGVFSFAQLLDQAGEYTLGFATTNSSDQVLNSTLFLDDAAGECNPSCNDLGSPENPLLPIDDDTPDSFDFSFEVTEPTIPVFIDPIVAVGYDYIVNSGPNVASVILPDLGDGEYEVYGWDGLGFNTFLGDAFANIAFDFGLGGIDQFQVLGIETSEMLDPTDPVAFVTGLTFSSVGGVDISQIPVTFDVPASSVPETGTLPLIGLGMIGFYCLRRRSKGSI